MYTRPGRDVDTLKRLKLMESLDKIIKENVVFGSETKARL